MAESSFYAGDIEGQIKELADQVGTKVNTSAIANNLTTTSAGYVLDARQGKTLLDKFNKQGLIASSGTTAFSTTLTNCTGTIKDNLKWQQNANNTITIYGRCTIESYVRTGANPGIKITLPNSLKSKNAFIIYPNGYVAGSSQGIRYGENIQMSATANSTQISLTTTESYNNWDSATRAWIVISPITIEVA